MPDSTYTYQLGPQLGSGAVAVVLQVRRSDGAVFAGKRLHASLRGDLGSAERFLQEAQLAAALRHPNLVAVHGPQLIEGEPVLLMELVEGPTLAQVCARDAPLPEERLLRVLRGIAAGLAVAHTAGVIHRDLKPANVLLARGDIAKIADFGMARASSLTGVARDTFTVLGTPDYMAPECLEPLAVDPRSDLYALGCIGFELATGAPPYGGATPLAVLEQHRAAPIPALPADYSPGLAALLRALLAKAPAERPAAAGAVVDALDALLRGADAEVPQPRSLALRPTTTPGPARSLCARCGAPGLAEVPVCFGCGLARVGLAPGAYSLFVVGPGEIADQLDATLRERLLRWLEGSPDLGLDPAPLAKRLPRLPFAIATGVSLESAGALAGSLQALGLRCQCVRGGSANLSAMGKKVARLSGRTLAIVAASSAGVWGNLLRHPLFGFSALGLAILVAVGASVRTATRAVVKRRALAPPLPEVLQRSIATLQQVVPQMQALRHRQDLQGVVERALALRAALPAARRDALDEDLAQALDHALVASARVDDLDRALCEADLQEPDAATRERLHERDTLAGRLLDLHAHLDALAARLAYARAREGQAEDREQLDELRLRIAALEEVNQVTRS